MWIVADYALCQILRQGAHSMAEWNGWRLRSQEMVEVGRSKNFRSSGLVAMSSTDAWAVRVVQNSI